MVRYYVRRDVDILIHPPSQIKSQSWCITSLVHSSIIVSYLFTGNKRIHKPWSVGKCNNYTCTSALTHTQVHACTNARTYTHTRTDTHTYTRSHTQIHTRTLAHARAHTHALAHTRMRMRTRTRPHARTPARTHGNCPTVCDIFDNYHAMGK